MYWEEKIDALKKRYSKDKFDVPHVKRKEILRKIESKFISRPQNYYYSNEFASPFINWWDNLKSDKNTIEKIHCENLLPSLIANDRQYWIACEFETQILLYKANLEAIITLCYIGRTWSNKYHIIDLKYNSMVSLYFLKWNKIELKLCGETIDSNF